MHQKTLVVTCVVLTLVLANPISQRPTQSIDAKQLLDGEQLSRGKSKWEFDILDGHTKTISDKGEGLRANSAIAKDASVGTSPISIANRSPDMSHTRRRDVSPKDQNACPVNNTPLRHHPPSAQASPKPTDEGHPTVNPASPTKHTSGDLENPCGAFLKPIRRPIHVTCNGPRIGPDPFHPAYVLNCVRGFAEFIPHVNLLPQTPGLVEFCCVRFGNRSPFWVAYECCDLNDPVDAIRTSIIWSMDDYIRFSTQWTRQHFLRDQDWGI